MVLLLLLCRDFGTSPLGNKNILCSMTCGGDEVIVTKLSGKSPYYLRDLVTTQSWGLDLTPTKISNCWAPPPPKKKKKKKKKMIVVGGAGGERKGKREKKKND